jgi:hypothetical protein
MRGSVLLALVVVPAAGPAPAAWAVPAIAVGSRSVTVTGHTQAKKAHPPDPLAIADVIAVFANAPVANPDGTTGITLHVTDDEALPDGEAMSFVPCADKAGANVDFDALKQQFFGTAAERGSAADVLEAKRLAYRYGIWGHGLNGLDDTSGCAEIGGNDFIVSLGRWRAAGGTRSEQAGTFLHEFGHTLGLRHGGADDNNCKPNYLSAMN